MYTGTLAPVGGSAETRRKGGAAYVTRTRDPIITNKGYSRQTAVFPPICRFISPICAVFVRLCSPVVVQAYIGRRGAGNTRAALTTTRKDRDMADQTNRHSTPSFLEHLRAPTRRRHCIDQAVNLLPPPTRPSVYFIGGASFRHIKIGFATDVYDRLYALQTGNPSPLIVYAYWPGTMDDERAAHEVFKDDRGNGEWFERSKRLEQAIRALQFALTRPLGIVLPRPQNWELV